MIVYNDNAGRCIRWECKKCGAQLLFNWFELEKDEGTPITQVQCPVCAAGYKHVDEFLADVRSQDEPEEGGKDESKKRSHKNSKGVPRK